ncbi:porin [Flocculibacter collagenilyticus]|uniref:porin n=1 Tax=Flocculibacter collagenilyticus TaxID=2744479 RepID=UPI0018F69A65|nr:porin [Flocculibacter collagenilyticus]
MKKTLIYTSLALAIMQSYSASAEIRFNGFASIKAGIASSDDILYEYDDEIDFKNESLFAIQASADMGDKLSATAQIMAKGRNDFEAEFEWAFLTYELTETLQVSAGRIRTPFYKYSDYLDVGFAYPWVRPPRSIYNIGFATIEGISLYHSDMFGDWDVATQFIYGNFNDTVKPFLYNENAYPVDIQDALGLSVSMTRDWFNFRVGYLQGDLSTDFAAVSPAVASILNGLRAFDQALIGLGAQPLGLEQKAQDVEMVEDPASFLDVSINIDYNDFLINTEWSKLTIDDSFSADREGWFVSVGKRIGDFTPYIVIEHFDSELDESLYQDFPTLTLPIPELQQNYAALQAGVQGLVFSDKVDNDAWTVGVRYNFHPSAAFKIQYTENDDKFMNQTSSLISFGVDLVF